MLVLGKEWLIRAEFVIPLISEICPALIGENKTCCDLSQLTALKDSVRFCQTTKLIIKVIKCWLAWCPKSFLLWYIPHFALWSSCITCNNFLLKQVWLLRPQKCFNNTVIIINSFAKYSNSHQKPCWSKNRIITCCNHFISDLKKLNTPSPAGDAT